MPRGRPRYEPTAADHNTVASMAACGFPHDEIAKCIGDPGIDPKTLRRHFHRELETAALKATATVANMLYQRAIAGDLGAMCFWLKCRAGWKEKQEIAHSGADGQPMKLSIEMVDEIIRRGNDVGDAY
jgi:hypothetical protein